MSRGKEVSAGSERDWRNEGKGGGRKGGRKEDRESEMEGRREGGKKVEEWKLEELNKGRRKE